MFRSLNDVLSVEIDKKEIPNILISSNSVKEKFIIGIKFIYSSEKADIGFIILNSIKSIDTCHYVNPIFVEELLTPNSRSSFVSFKVTWKVIQFILANASNTKLFDMAIHQHIMAQYATNPNVEAANLQQLLIYIQLTVETLRKQNLQPSASNDQDATVSIEFLKTVYILIVKKLSEVPTPRDSIGLKALNTECIPIVEFFRSKETSPQERSLRDAVLGIFIELIYSEKELSPLTCLVLTIVPDKDIEEAVRYILQMSNLFKNQKKVVLKAVNRLVVWQLATNFKVPLHLWIVKVLQTLHDEEQYEILEEIVLEHLVKSLLTLIIPTFQERTFKVVQKMLKIQRSEKVFLQIAPRLHNVLTRLKNTQSVIFEPFMNDLANYISSFANVDLVCKEVIQFLEQHGVFIDRSMSKYRRLSFASSLKNNVRIGLVNLHNTCYINSVLQALFMTKVFCNEVLKLESGRDRETTTLQKIFALLSFSNRPEINLTFAMQHIRPPDFAPDLQHDSSEFMGHLLEKIHEADRKYIQTQNGNLGDNEEACSIKVDDDKTEDVVMSMDGEESTSVVPMEKTTDNTTELNESTVVQRIFGGKISTTCVCLSCKSKSISIDSFRDLALSFPEKKPDDDDWNATTSYTVQDLLDYYFTTEQLTLDGDNQYNCDNCKIFCDGVRCTELLQSPKNLILTLKHFHYDQRQHTRSKLNHKMLHNEEITVKVRSGQEVRAVDYKLYAAVVHSGRSLDSGHYYTFAREKDQIWYKFDDSCVSTSSLQDLHNLNSPNTPYILFYRRISTSSSTASSSTATFSNSQAVINDDILLTYENLHQSLKKFVVEDNDAFKKESKKFAFQPNNAIKKPNSWNDDDPPPSSCGSNMNLHHNSFIF